MRDDVMFLDCPAYMDEPGDARCGLPAAVESRSTVGPTGGALAVAKISCPRGHWFQGPVDALTLSPAVAAAEGQITSHPARTARAGRRRRT